MKHIKMQVTLSNNKHDINKKHTRLLGSYTKLFSEEDAYRLIDITSMMIYNIKTENNEVYKKGLNILLALKPINLLLWLVPKVFLHRIFYRRKEQITSICNLYFKYGMTQHLEEKLQKNFSSLSSQHKQHLQMNFPELFKRPEITQLELELLNINKYKSNNVSSKSDYFTKYTTNEYHAVLSLRYILATHLISLDHQDKRYEVFIQNIYKSICLLNNGPSNAIRLQNELLIAHKTLIVSFCYRIISNQNKGPLQDYFDHWYEKVQLELTRLDNEANVWK